MPVDGRTALHQSNEMHCSGVVDLLWHWGTAEPVLVMAAMSPGSSAEACWLQTEAQRMCPRGLPASIDDTRHDSNVCRSSSSSEVTGQRQLLGLLRTEHTVAEVGHRWWQEEWGLCQCAGEPAPGGCIVTCYKCETKFGCVKNEAPRLRSCGFTSPTSCWSGGLQARKGRCMRVACVSGLAARIKDGTR